MTRKRRWTLTLAVGLVSAASIAVCLQIQASERLHQPVAYAQLGRGGDPLVISIGIDWTADGYCPGRFTVRATESATEVRIVAVVDRARWPHVVCAGVGTADNTAYAALYLTTPLGDRAVIRDSDGARLPDRTRPDPLRRQTSTVMRTVTVSPTSTPSALRTAAFTGTT